jgi:segregation and condensation protein A
LDATSLHAASRRSHTPAPEWTATLYDLLSAYSHQRQEALSRVMLAKRAVWSLAEARVALERLIGQSTDWTRIDEYLIKYVVEPSTAATVFASSFASALELVREGLAEIHQHQAFAPIYMRKRVAVAAVVSEPAQGAAIDRTED